MHPAFTNKADQAKEIKRRSRSPYNFAGIPAYKTSRGYWQADQSLEASCYCAIEEGTFLIHLPMQPEDYYAGMDQETMDVRTGKIF